MSLPIRCLSPDRIHITSLFGLSPEVLRVYGCLLFLRAGVAHLLASEHKRNNACSTPPVSAKGPSSHAVSTRSLIAMTSSSVVFVSYQRATSSPVKGWHRSLVASRAHPS